MIRWTGEKFCVFMWQIRMGIGGCVLRDAWTFFGSRFCFVGLLPASPRIRESVRTRGGKARADKRKYGCRDQEMPIAGVKPK